MKKTNKIIITLILVSSSFLLSQSIVIPTGTSLYVLSGADICAGSWGNITGNLIGEGSQCEGALPVELSLFTAEFNKGSVLLKWITETEVDNYGFDVERCIQYEDWKKIGFVEVYGNSNSPKDYTFIDNSPTGGSKFQYRLKQIDTDGEYEYSDIVEVEIVPTKFVLYQNYPNPFNSTTTIRYSLPQSSSIEIIVYNTIGEIIKQELIENKEAGNYEWRFNGDNLSSGTYFHRLQAGDFIQTKKMILMK